MRCMQQSVLDNDQGAIEYSIKSRRQGRRFWYTVPGRRQCMQVLMAPLAPLSQAFASSQDMLCWLHSHGPRRTLAL